MTKRILNLKATPDGSGRILTHYLVEVQGGPIRTEGVMFTPDFHGVRKEVLSLGKLERRWVIACNHEQNTVNPQTRNGETFMCMHTPELMAVTCEKCKASPEAIAQLALAERLEREKNEASEKIMGDAQAAHELAVGKNSGAIAVGG